MKERKNRSILNLTEISAAENCCAITKRFNDGGFSRLLLGVTPTGRVSNQMLNIITKIIEIDDLAQDKLKQAADVKEKAIAEINAAIEKQNKETADEIEMKLTAVTDSESTAAERQKQEITAEINKKLAELDKIYSTEHERLENEIYADILKI